MSSSSSSGQASEADTPVHYGHEFGRSYMGYEMPFDEPEIVPEDAEFHTFFPCDTILYHRYQIKKLIGKGTFCLVWLANDLLERKNVAIKVLKKENDEDVEVIINKYLSILQCNDDHVVLFRDMFFHGFHLCLVFDLACQNILTFISYYDSPNVHPPMSLVKKIALDVLKGLHFMHTNGVIHTDLKPENVLASSLLFPSQSFTDDLGIPLFNPLYHDPVSVKFLLTDLGNSCFIDHHLNTLIQTRQYRAPEVILQLDYDTSADIWSLACMIFELVTRRHLFNPELPNDTSQTDDDSPEHDALHLTMINSVVGPIPRDWAMNGELYDDFFDENGNFIIDPHGEANFLPVYERLIYHKIPEKDAREVSEFIGPMLSIIPACRPTAADLLEHPWFNIM